MVEWVAGELAHILQFVGETWGNTPSPVKAIIIAAFGTLIGAFLTSRSQTKRRIIEELRAIHAAYTISLATVNRALGIKRRYIRPMKAKFDSDVAIYEAWTEHPKGPLGVEAPGLQLVPLDYLSTRQYSGFTGLRCVRENA